MFIYVCMYACVCKFHSLKAIKMFIYICMYACVYVYMCFTRWLSTDVFHSWSLQYAFDPATTSSVVYGVYGGTEWGPQIRFCVVTSRSRSKIRITFESRSKIRTMIQIRTKIFSRLAICRATNAKCITIFVRGLPYHACWIEPETDEVHLVQAY